MCSMTVDTRTNEIRVGQALNLATQYALLSGSVTSPEDCVALAEEVLPTFLEAINKIQAKVAFALAATTPITAAPSAQAVNGLPPYGSGQLNVPPPPPPGAGAPPAPVPGVASELDVLRDRYRRLTPEAQAKFQALKPASDDPVAIRAALDSVS